MAQDQLQEQPDPDPAIRFSRRSSFSTEQNPFAEALARLTPRPDGFIDLTVSNPTRAGFTPHSHVGAPAGAPPDARLSDYDPTPHGSLETRRAIAGYYAAHYGAALDPQRLFLTASTSEAYTVLLDLLGDPGDAVLVPAPGYPLFEMIARPAGIELIHYPLTYDDRNGWHIDREQLAGLIHDRVRAILVVSPNNPTGNLLTEGDLKFVNELCTAHHLALIVDEVFRDYLWRAPPAALNRLYANDPLTFVLNGMSKLAAAPQLKLGWIALSGPDALVRTAENRLEILLDSLLSVSQYAQRMTPGLLSRARDIQAPIRTRLNKNRAHLESLLEGSPVTPLKSDGGWYAVLKLPPELDGENGLIRLMQQKGVLAHPGYFYGFEDDETAVISLLPEEALFAQGIEKLKAFAVAARYARFRRKRK